MNGSSNHKLKKLGYMILIIFNGEFDYVERSRDEDDCYIAPEYEVDKDGLFSSVPGPIQRMIVPG